MSNDFDFQPVDDLTKLFLRLSDTGFMGILALRGPNGEAYDMSWVFGMPCHLKSEHNEGLDALRSLLQSEEPFEYALTRDQPIPDESNLTGRIEDILARLAEPEVEATTDDQVSDATEAEEMNSVAADRVGRTQAEDDTLPVWPDLVPIPLSEEDRERVSLMDAEAGFAASVYQEIREQGEEEMTIEWAAQEVVESPSTPAVEDLEDSFWREEILDQAKALAEDEGIVEAVTDDADEVKAIDVLDLLEHSRRRRTTTHEDPLRLTTELTGLVAESEDSVLWRNLSVDFISVHDMILQLEDQKFNGYIEAHRGGHSGKLLIFAGHPTAWVLGADIWLVADEGNLEAAADEGDLLDVVSFTMTRDDFFNTLLRDLELVFTNVPTQALKWDGILDYVNSAGAAGVVVMDNGSEVAMFYLRPHQEPVLHGPRLTDDWFRDALARASFYASKP